MWWFFWIVWIVGVLIVLAYAAVLPFGAPFLPTLKGPTTEALDLIDLKPGQTFIDLGCGDGRVLIIAAQRGLKAIGYELNPFLVVYAWLRTRRYGGKVKIRWANFWRADLSKVDGVFVFLVDHYMGRLDKMLTKYSKNHQIKLVSHAFKIPGKKPIAQKGALFLYLYNPPTQNIAGDA